MDRFNWDFVPGCKEIRRISGFDWGKNGGGFDRVRVRVGNTEIDGCGYLD